MHKNENKELKSKLASLQERLSDKEVREEKYQRKPSLVHHSFLCRFLNVCIGHTANMLFGFWFG